MFEHLKKYDIAERTAEFAMPWIEGTPVLVVRPGTEANRDYATAQLRLSRTQLRALAERPTVRVLDELRDRFRVLYPKHVIVGWQSVTDDDGKPVEFSIERAQEFVNALPDWLFDKIVVFCSDANNFAPGEDVMLGN